MVGNVKDESFDVVVSNFTFHEVRDARDKREVIREALRVLRKGGWFSLQDVFLDKRLYGDIADLLETIRGWGVEQVLFTDSGALDGTPYTLYVLGAFVEKIKGEVFAKLVYTDTLFRFQVGKEERMVEKAYSLGKKIN